MAACTYYDSTYYEESYGVRHIRRGMFNLPPKVLLFHEENEDPDRDIMVNYLKKWLGEKHIGCTSDLNDIETVQMSIVFINKSFLRNCSHFLDRFVNEARGSAMWNTAVWYGIRQKSFLRELRDAPLGYPDLRLDPSQQVGEAEKNEYKRLLDLIEYHYGPSMNVSDCYVNVSISVVHTQDAMEPVIMKVVEHLNPTPLNFLKINKKVDLSSVCRISYNLYNEIVSNPGGSSLIAIVEGCLRRCCQLKTISYLFWTLISHRSFNRFLYTLYVRRQPPGTKRRSLFNHFHDTFIDKYPGFSQLYPSTMRDRFFVVIEGLEDFLSKKEDNPAIMLANFVNKLGRGSLVITTCGIDVTTTIRSRSTTEMPTQIIQGTQCCSTRGTRPACFTILNKRLNELFLKPYVSEPVNYNFLKDDGMDPDTDDEMWKPEEYQRYVHLRDTEGSALKKPRMP